MNKVINYFLNMHKPKMEKVNFTYQYFTSI